MKKTKKIPFLFFMMGLIIEYRWIKPLYNNTKDISWASLPWWILFFVLFFSVFYVTSKLIIFLARDAFLKFPKWNPYYLIKALETTNAKVCFFIGSIIHYGVCTVVERTPACVFFLALQVLFFFLAVAESRIKILKN